MRTGDPDLFTPDGRAVLVCSDGVTQLVDVATGRPVVLAARGARTDDTR